MGTQPSILTRARAILTREQAPSPAPFLPAADVHTAKPGPVPSPDNPPAGEGTTIHPSAIIPSGGSTLLATDVAAEGLRRDCAYSMAGAILRTDKHTIHIEIDPLAHWHRSSADGTRVGGHAARMHRLVRLVPAVRGDLGLREDVMHPGQTVIAVTGTYQGYDVVATTSVPALSSAYAAVNVERRQMAARYSLPDAEQEYDAVLALIARADAAEGAEDGEPDE